MMKQIHKEDAPDFFLDFCHRNRPKVWEDIAPIRKELRGHLLCEQGGCCAYTEMRINSDENCHIDHYYTRNLYPEKTFDYRNLLVSCNSENYGAKYKDKQVKGKDDYKKLINPIEDNPSDYMEYTFMGEVQALDGNERGKATIECFHLNERNLLNRRKNAICSFVSMKHDFNEDELVEIVGEFETMLRQLYKQF